MRACCYAYSLHALGIPQAMNFPLAPHRYPTIVSATALGMLALMLVLLAGAPLYTEDLWWHLKAGQMYFTEGPWPDSDWMLHTASDDAPIQHEWLFGVSVYALERLLGFHGLRVVHAAAVALTVWLALSMFRRSSEWPTAACLAACVFVVLAWRRLFQFRPDLVSIIATFAGYRLLLEGEEPPSVVTRCGIHSSDRRLGQLSFAVSRQPQPAHRGDSGGGAECRSGALFGRHG